jgi:hypothetical protein
MPLAFA